jgi:ribonuclease HI
VQGTGFFRSVPSGTRSFVQIVEIFFDICDGEEVYRFSSVVWRLWLRRNKVLHEGIFVHPVALIQAARNATVSFQAAHASVPSTGVSESLDGERAPPAGWVTAHWDAAINKQHGRWGLGVILRDHTGRMIGAKCFARVGCLDPTAAEAIAALEATRFCTSLGVDRLMLVGDAKLVVEAVLANKPDWSTKGHIIEAIKKQTLSFQHWRMIHVTRGANQITHVLAKMEATQGIENEWFSEPPNCIKETIVAEQDLYSGLIVLSSF